MKLLFSLLIVFSLMTAPLAQAADLCDVESPASSCVVHGSHYKSDGQSHSKSAAKGHCCMCTHCHDVSGTMLLTTPSSVFAFTQEKLVVEAAALSGLGPQGLLKPPRTV